MIQFYTKVQIIRTWYNSRSKFSTDVNWNSPFLMTFLAMLAILREILTET